MGAGSVGAGSVGAGSVGAGSVGAGSVGAKQTIDMKKYLSHLDSVNLTNVY